MANTLKSFRQGAVGFIGWLGLSEFRLCPFSLLGPVVKLSDGLLLPVGVDRVKEGGASSAVL